MGGNFPCYERVTALMKPIDSKGSPFTQKVRRSALGAPRAPGRKWQQGGNRVKRPDPTRWVRGAPATNLSAVGGLAEFGAFCRTEGIDEQLSKQFGAMKTGSGVVYPMDAQLRLLIDAAIVGIPRVFGLEGMASDPLFTLLAGGAMPSIDTVYRDMQRFEPDTLERLEKLMAEQGLALVRDAGLQQLTLDIDPTVMELFGEQQYAGVGYNPRYRGRRSYQPVMALGGRDGYRDWSPASSRQHHLRTSGCRPVIRPPSGHRDAHPRRETCLWDRKDALLLLRRQRSGDAHQVAGP